MLAHAGSLRRDRSGLQNVAAGPQRSGGDKGLRQPGPVRPSRRRGRTDTLLQTPLTFLLRFCRDLAFSGRRNLPMMASSRFGIRLVAQLRELFVKSGDCDFLLLQEIGDEGLLAV